jgi:hypothetical protein
MDAIDHTLRSFTPVVYQNHTGSWEVAKIRSIDDLITGLVDKELTIATLLTNTEYDHLTETKSETHLNFRSTAVEKAWKLYDEMDATLRVSHTPKVLESVVDGHAVKPTIRNDFSSIEWHYSIRDAERDDIPPASAIHRCSRNGCVICDSRREFVSIHTLHHYHHAEGPH